MTFAEFENIPDSPFRHELRHGVAVCVAPAQDGRKRIQRKLRSLLEQTAGAAGLAETEVGFQAASEYEYWCADVAYMPRQRWDAIPDEGYLSGPPDLVAEVLSPSNTVREMEDRERVCLDHGCREFWIVDSARRQVSVSTPDGRRATYKSGQQIPLFFGAPIDVDDIFG